MPVSLIDQALKVLPAKTLEETKDFLREFFLKTPHDDMALLGAEAMVRIAQDHLKLAQGRKAGEVRIAIRTLSAKEDPTAPAGRTVIDIVNDDMAFLVDSVASEVTRYGRLVHLLLHPILYHSKTGFTVKPSEHAKGQSHIHIRLQGVVPDNQMAQLDHDLRRVLSHVQCATRDWIAIRQKLRDCQKSVLTAPSHFPREDVEEYLQFLDYLWDNFTLLGYREFKFMERKGEVRCETVAGTGLGLLHDDVQPPYIDNESDRFSSEIQRLRREMPPLVVSKISKLSTVHRRVPLDSVTVKHYDKDGNAAGECLFIGLFTSVTYSRSITDVPYIRRKAESVMKESGFKAGTHDYKGLKHILEKYPRDELFQLETGALLKTGLSILRLQERQRIALYTRADSIGRYVSCLVYVPRDRYDTRLRQAMQEILEEELKGTCSNFYTTLDDSALARAMFIIHIDSPKMLRVDTAKIEARLQEVGRLWSERLGEALLHKLKDSEEAKRLTLRYGEAFPLGYQELYKPSQAVHDIAKVETVLQTERLGIDLYRTDDCSADKVRLKIFHPQTPMSLSAIMPMLWNMGLQALTETPFEVCAEEVERTVWVHDFLLEVEPSCRNFDLGKVKGVFEEALENIWTGVIENDALNRLVLGGGLPGREAVIIRAYVRYLRQVGTPFSTRYIERCLTNNPAICRDMIALFMALNDPKGGKQKSADALQAGINKALESVSSLDEDRILRSILTLVNATLRTNFFQTNADGAAKPCLSFKLDSKAIPDLPEPKPYREIFVYSPRVEAVHLRSDVIARGGIRWSDRHEDFRTEILSLMKAQQVKNSVIVPMGAKGGFVVKQPPADGNRAAMQAEGIECYKVFVRGLLDITDNRKGTKVVPPKDVVRRDSDDPYLVVAADKGTATFSDIANGLSTEYGFWLGDAFASGGSAGYDHKKIGITARGAWESIMRHFRELGHDTQTKPFDVVGVGDMGGDVFGNGLLRSEQARLIGAFNHVHIFCDPNPDPAATFKERVRLFNAVKGWDEYNVKLLSKGGRIYNRKDKALELTPEIRARFDINKDKVTPTELIQAILRSRTDLLFFGGIGTYIKSTKETHADAGDRTNESLRINANEIRAKVIGEGANLAMTQRSRIEAAQNGVKLNADFIDNSGGVDCSDHEVNIKILLAEIMSGKDNTLTAQSRNKLLEQMTEEVAALVLRDNYQQAQALSLMELQAVDHLSLQARFIQDLERDHGLNRALECLPDEEEIQIRLRQGKGLTRPELGILQAHAKILFTRELLASDVPDHPDTQDWLVGYFPLPLQKKFKAEIGRHRLRREIIATTLATAIINRMGAVFVKSCMDRTGASAADVARAWIVVREVFGLEALWAEIESLDGKANAQIQLKAMREISKMAERETLWFLTRLGRAPDIGQDIAGFKSGVEAFGKALDGILTPDQVQSVKEREQLAKADGLPAALAHRLATLPALGAACDIIRISLERKAPVALAASTYFALGEHFHIDWLRRQAEFMTAGDRWTAEAVANLIENLYACQAGLTVRVLTDMKTHKGKGDMMTAWLDGHGREAAQLDPFFAAIRRAGTLDMPMLVIAEQRLRGLYGG